jgi:hypothetical protein
MGKDNKPFNKSLQSGEPAAGAGQDATEFGAGGQRDQGTGGQQHQQHDVDRDSKLKAEGVDARTSEDR